MSGTASALPSSNRRLVRGPNYPDGRVVGQDEGLPVAACKLHDCMHMYTPHGDK